MITGVVLVGAGLSSRMKAFKPMLPFGESTISLHLISVLKKFNLSPIVVVTGYKGQKLKDHLKHTGVRFVENNHYETTQMFDSVKLGIKAIADECDRILIMPLDVPAIQEKTYELVLNIDSDMIRTVYKELPGHPILLKKDIALKLCEYQGDGGLRGAMENSGFPLTNINVNDAGVRRDIDTKKDYQELLNWNFARGGGYPLLPKVSIVLHTQEKMFGPGTYQLLKYIDETGSLQQACNKMELSYSKGSKMIKIVEKQLGYSIVKRWSGGAKGGGSCLSDKGHQLLRNYKELLDSVEKFTLDRYNEIFIKGK